MKYYNCGINCDAGSVEQVAKAIDSFVNDKKLTVVMSQNARKMGAEKFERSKTYGEILKGVQKLL